MFAYEASRAVWTEKQRGVESIDQTAVKKALKRLIRELAVASAWFYATHTLPRTEQMTVEGTALAYRDGRILMSGFGSKLAEESYTSGLFPNTFYSFQNATLHVGFVELQNFMHFDEAGWPSGFAGELLTELAAHFKFKYLLTQSPNNRIGKRDKDGRWNGLMNLTIEKRIDIAVGHIAITAERARAVCFLENVLSAELRVFVRKSSLDSPFHFLWPFERFTWLLIGLSLLVAPLCICLLNRLSPFSAWNLNLPEASPDEVNLVENTWSLFGALSLHGQELYPCAYSSRSLVAFWWIFTVLLYATYQAVLVSSLTHTPTILPVEFLHQLADTDAVVPLVVNNSYAATFFKASRFCVMLPRSLWVDQPEGTGFTNFGFQNAEPDSLSHRIGGRVMEVSLSEGLDLLCNSDGYALIHDDKVIRAALAGDQKDIVMLSEKLATFYYGFAVACGTEFEEAFSNRIRRLKEIGIIGRASERWFPSFKKERPSMARGIEVQLKHCSGAFIILAVGVGLSVVALLIECLFFKYSPLLGPRLVA
ncbi:Glutamate receptor ionotropic, delta-1 [Sparganum proliferum]